MAPPLVLPLKAPSEYESTKSLLSSLEFWVDNSHPHYKSNKIQTDLKRLASLRKDLLQSSLGCRDGHASALSNDRALENLMEYHACLYEYELRGFPTVEKDAHVNGALDAGLSFSWCHAFDGTGNNKQRKSLLKKKKGNSIVDTSTSITQRHNLRFERACVLWNLAALESHLAAREDPSTVEGRAEGKRRCGLAALYLQYLGHLIHEDNVTSSPEFGEEWMQVCISVMLGRGMECAYNAARARLHLSSGIHNDNNRNINKQRLALQGLLSKLSVGVSHHYQKALEHARSPDATSRLSPDVTGGWGAHVKGVQYLYGARAEYVRAQSCRTEAHYGMEIGRLRKAFSMVESGIAFVSSATREGILPPAECDLDAGMGGTFASSLSSSPGGTGLNGELTMLRRAIWQRLEVAEKDNRSLYRESVPTEDQLDPIPSMDMMTQYIIDDDSDDDENKNKKNLTMDERMKELLPPEIWPENLSRPIFYGVPKNY